MAIKTYKLLTWYSKLLVDNTTSFWAAIGKTSDWPDEPRPDSEAPGTTLITEPIVYVKAEYVSLAYPINTGTEDVTVRGRKYKFSSTSTALENLARFIYLRFRLDPTIGQPYDDFRQFGVYKNLSAVAGHESDLWLPPAYVDAPGDLIYYNNRYKFTMSSDDQETVQVII